MCSLLYRGLTVLQVLVLASTNHFSQLSFLQFQLFQRELYATIAEFGKPDEELETCKAELTEQEVRLQAKVSERDQKKLILSNQQEAAERRKKALAAVATLQAKKIVTEQNRVTQQAIADSSNCLFLHSF